MRPVSSRSRLLPALGMAVLVPLLAPSVSQAEKIAAFNSENCVEAYRNSLAGGMYGMACFTPEGEILEAYDRRKDGRGIRAELVYGAMTATVNDPNGADGPFGRDTPGRYNLQIAEGRKVRLRVCVDGVGCSPYRTMTA